MTMDYPRFVLVSLAEAEEKNPGCTLSLKNVLGSLSNVVFFQDFDSESSLLAMDGVDYPVLEWTGEEWNELEDWMYDAETRDDIMDLRDGRVRPPRRPFEDEEDPL